MLLATLCREFGGMYFGGTVSRFSFVELLFSELACRINYGVSAYYRRPVWIYQKWHR